MNKPSQAILVTGTSSGFGRAIAAGLARDGHRVFATTRGTGTAVPGATHVTLDVTDEASVAAAAQAALALGDVRALINNAGRAHGSSMRKTDYASWRRDIALNLDGAFLCIHAFQEYLLAGGGSIVNMGSVNGIGMYGQPAYSAAKAGLLHLTHCLAVEFGPHNLRVNAIAPGTVRTQAWNHRMAINPAVFEEVTSFYPMGRVALPQDVANAVAFLVSDEAAYLTGVVLPVDGGISAGIPQLPAAITQER